MFTAILLASLAGSALAAPVIRRDDQPDGWATNYLEDYDVYHTRYLALDCRDKHNTTFFDDCCHPLLASESLTDREAYCTPSAEASSTAATMSASTDTDAASEFGDATSSVESVYESVVATATATPSADWTTVLSTSAAEKTSTLKVVEQYAPETTSSSTHTSTHTHTSTAAAETTAASSGNVNTGGFATYFYQNGNPGECGNYNSDDTPLVAIDSNGWWKDYASNDNSRYCGKYLTIKNTNNGKTVTAVVADVCPTCTTDNSLDLSVGAFTAIASESEGMVPIEWWWN